MSGPDELIDAVRKVVGDKPLYLIAGAGDLVNEKLRELPDALTALQSEYRDFPMRAAGALIGQAFRANIRVGALYDELTRRGEDLVAKRRGEAVFAEEDEPFVREPFMPEPIRSPRSATAEPAARPPAKKQTAKKQTARKQTAKNTAAKNASPKGAAAPKKSARRRPPS
jgi:hypothetical protein